MKSFKLSSKAVALLVSVGASIASAQVMVGGASMLPSKDIIENAVDSKDHTTLVAAVKAASLVDTLKSAGPFTVFAPTNAAFAALPPGTVDAATLVKMINDGGGKVTVKTVAGGGLTAMMKDQAVIIADESGNTATVTIADVMQCNGVIHVVNTVLLPK